MKKIFSGIWFFIMRITLPLVIVFAVVAGARPEVEPLVINDLTSIVYMILFVLLWNLWRSEAKSLDQVKKAYMKSVEDDSRNGYLDQAHAEAGADSHVSFQKSMYVISLLLSMPAYLAIYSGFSIILTLVLFVVGLIVIGGLWSLIS
jgi:hypothetical protein|tara:strand:+ start:1087 stop:1527 length:441 start_codon:yes stop_codon:yes gene_type:complete